MPRTAMGFPSTHWTVILEARDGPGTQGQDALARLCTAYWYPLYAFIRRRGASPQDAEDLTQGFLCHFLERDALARVQPAAGKFRSFLLGCLKKYLSKERERAQAQKRGGACQWVPLDGEEAELRYARELADTATPEALFERRWAISVLEQTMAAMRQEYSTPEKRSLFEDLQRFLFAGREEASRSEVAAKRGVTTGAIDVAIHRLRQRFGALLREQVVRTVSSEAEVDEEIRYLRSLMSA
jgi:RNA polymerase sigma factor (sigma-70 family)